VKGLEGVAQGSLHLAHGRLEDIRLTEMQLEQETMVIADVTA
jgi:hypothetical protein